MFASPLDEARVLVSRGQIDPAIQILSEALNSDFFDIEALFMLGSCLIEKGFHGFGYVVTATAYEASVATKKPLPEALLNMGTAAKYEHHNDQARHLWLNALELETRPVVRAKIMVNIAGLSVNENDAETAIEWCDKALQTDPNCHGARAQRGMACLELGRWREGWDGWKATYLVGDRARKDYGVPVWDGSPGKHVIVFGDQGVGDEIWGAACLADLRAMSRHVTFDCHPRLTELFRRSFPDITVYGTRKDLSTLPWLAECDADAAIGLADLPGFFRNQGEWNGKPYIKAQPPLIDGQTSLRVGLSWSGGTKRTRSALRSLPLQAFEPILRARPNAQFFSLQYTPDAAREVCELEEKTGIRVAHFPGQVECYDYDTTAGFVASLDLVITVCTTVHHLAGALGIPCLTLVPSRASWRYQSKGATLPWYNSVKLLRQEKDGDWTKPIQRAAETLAARAWRR